MAKQQITIQELLNKSGMTKSEFAAYFNIPLRTLDNWITDSCNHRDCSPYLLNLIKYKLRFKREKLDHSNVSDIKTVFLKSGMTKTQFAAYFDIPMRTVDNWLTDSSNHRDCSPYLVALMEYKLSKNETKKDVK